MKQIVIFIKKDQLQRSLQQLDLLLQGHNNNKSGKQMLEGAIK